jgi:hypothetical protein
MFLNKIFPKNSFLRNMRYLALVFTTLIFNSVFAQGEDGDASKNVSLAELEADLAILGDKVVAGKLEEERLQSNK